MNAFADGGFLLPREPLTQLADYLAAGGGQATAVARATGPDTVIAAIRQARLRGRGGAGFPTAKKWAAVRWNPGPAPQVVCNAAEGEPGTFKDRWLLRTNPFQVLEGLAIAALAVGAKAAFIALKQGFDDETRLVRQAVADMQAVDLFGGLPVEIILGPDEYLFGEEKALLEVIEGGEPLPRILPPHRVGLFARRGMANPTLVHNAETLANVPVILRDSGERFRSVGSPGSPGTKLFTVTGDVARPGVYELPMGTPLAALLAHAGGPLPGADLKVAFAGASGSPIPASVFGTPLDFDALSAAGFALGAGGYTAYDESTCVVAATLQFVRFLWVESCAQCPACKQGALEIVEALERIETGNGSGAEVKMLRSKAGSVTGGSRCGLPAGTASLVRGFLEHFEDEVRQHLEYPCRLPRQLTLPKIVGYDREASTFTYDHRYRAKRPDWTYPTTGSPGLPLAPSTAGREEVT